jgi:hypothetical protein
MATAMLKVQNAGVRFFDILVKESKHPIHLTVRTPVFGMNILHLVVASLSLPMIKVITKHSPSSTRKTALQHSLLHIACLPLNESVVNWQSLAIATSVKVLKDARIIDEDWIPQRPPASYSLLGLDGKVELDVEADSSLALPQSIEYFEDQCKVIKFLIDCQGQPPDSNDLDQDTPRHYLASSRHVKYQSAQVASRNLAGPRSMDGGGKRMGL